MDKAQIEVRAEAMPVSGHWIMTIPTANPLTPLILHTYLYSEMMIHFELTDALGSHVWGQSLHFDQTPI